MSEHRKSLPGRLVIKIKRLFEQSGSVTYHTRIGKKSGWFGESLEFVYSREISIKSKGNLLEELQLVEIIALEGLKKAKDKHDELLADGWVEQ